MIHAAASNERGQAVVEFALIGTVFLMLTVGLLDVGRAFYSYVQLSSAARMAARWGSVQGGLCGDSQYSTESTADWCNKLGSDTTTAFWMQDGNTPKQGTSSCPATYDSTFTHYYTPSSSTYQSTPTVVGILTRRLETSGTSSSRVGGQWLAGLDMSQVKVCVSLPSDAYESGRTVPWQPTQGDWLSVYAYYSFHPVGHLFGSNLQINMVASSRYVVE